jgi:hypothetical protein
MVEIKTKTTLSFYGSESLFRFTLATAFDGSAFPSFFNNPMLRLHAFRIDVFYFVISNLFGFLTLYLFFKSLYIYFFYSCEFLNGGSFHRCG